ncbi:unnamed protein product, partial [marine sediment metagenome]
NEKLLKWVGISTTYRGPSSALCVREGYYAGNDIWLDKLPDFPNDLNACFERLVPKVLEKHAIIETYSFKQKSGLYYSETGIWDKGCRDSSSTEVLKCELVGKAFVQDFDLGKANALALCLAAEKAIDSIKEKE